MKRFGNKLHKWPSSVQWFVQNATKTSVPIYAFSESKARVEKKCDNSLQTLLSMFLFYSSTGVSSIKTFFLFINGAYNFLPKCIFFNFISPNPFCKECQICISYWLDFKTSFFLLVLLPLSIFSNLFFLVSITISQEIKFYSFLLVKGVGPKQP